MVVTRVGRGQSHPILKLHVLEQPLVLRRVSPPALSPPIQVCEFAPQHGRLESIQPAVESDHLIGVILAAPMDPQHADAISQRRGTGGHNPPSPTPPPSSEG